MSAWGSAKPRLVLAALLRIGWTLQRQSGSHRTLARDGWPNVSFAFHDGEELGPRMLAGSRSKQVSPRTICERVMPNKPLQ